MAHYFAVKTPSIKPEANMMSSLVQDFDPLPAARSKTPHPEISSVSLKVA